VSATYSVDAKINIYDRLFKVSEPGKENDLLADINEDSLHVFEAKAEPHLQRAKEGEKFQFQRTGYFVRTTNKETLEFNKTVGLRDSWKK
jgi:glutaminyl-tRNA synthetase